MAKIYIRTCKNCGAEFEAKSMAAAYCPKDECQASKGNHKAWMALPPESQDMPLGVIAEIMHDEQISYTEYAENRAKYIERWRLNRRFA